MAHGNQALFPALRVGVCFVYLVSAIQAWCVHLAVHLFQIVTIEPETAAAGALVSHDILDGVKITALHDDILAGWTGVAFGLIQAGAVAFGDCKRVTEVRRRVIAFLQF